ncbi:glycosyltransferase 87 family protein [Gordonia humi]|nr:glycosyltransferase 87 family protein [Gordonia humi]
MPRSTNRTPGLLLAASVVLLVVTTTLGLNGSNGYYLDLMVYRLGAQAWLDGDPVYGALPSLMHGSVHLPFTYPPLAAVVFAPLAAMPAGAAGALMYTLTFLAVGGTVWLVLRRLRPAVDPVTRLAAVVAVVAVAQFLEPVAQTLDFGQINAILMVMVAFDVLVPWRRWPRGVLIGIAISIKLTPAGFVLLFLVRRDWRALATTIVSTAVAIGLVWLVMPDDSRTYWFEKVRETGRIGAAHYAGNQSIRGMVARWGLGEHTTAILWLGLSVIAVAAAAVWMRRLLAEDRLATALTVNAAAILLVSPISWSHHWVWVVPALVIAAVAVLDGHRNAWFVGALVLALVVFYTGAHWFFPIRHGAELRWAWWEQIIGSAYVWFTFAVLAAGAWHSRADVRNLIRVR